MPDTPSIAALAPVKPAPRPTPFIALAAALALGATSPAVAYNGDSPPEGSLDASCVYDGGTPQFCRIKVIDAAVKQILIWHPEGRQSAMTMTYTGSCLQPGCVFTGEDLGYATGPARYEIQERSPSRIVWKMIGGGGAIEVFNIQAP